MKINTIGRKVALKDSFVSYAEKKLEKLDKFFHEDSQATITVTVEKSWQTVEIAIRDRKMTFRSEKSAEQMEEAFDLAVDSLETQILKNKGKLSQRHKKHGYEYFDETLDEMDDYVIERQKAFLINAQSVDEAILEMNLLAHDFHMFRDIVTDDIHVVYKRKNGNYGVIVPE